MNLQEAEIKIEGLNKAYQMIMDRRVAMAKLHKAKPYGTGYDDGMSDALSEIGKLQDELERLFSESTDS